MWDVALTEAIIHPDLATAVTIPSPPGGRRRPVSVWIEIDAAGMEKD